MFDLASYLPYLLNRAGSRIADSFIEVLRPHDITLTMWRVLAALDHQDGQRVGQIAALTSIEVSTLSRLIDALERKKLVERRRPGARSAGSDARAVTVHVTPAGRRLTQQLIPTALDYEAIALDGFSAAEAAAIKAMLLRLYHNMDRLDAAAPPARRGRTLAAE
ncbi:MAG TPA: MarR family transcriptional regulator [Alphaproteobacteria bacterium]|jgi:DNA-binding MarR family transcriptional regulator|nr:MarR family transcriptional regulator [Alphaproteobacteria bacterium]